MTRSAATPVSRRSTPSAPVRLAAVAAICAVGAFMLGRATAPEAQPTWESGRADVVGQKVTIETGDWTYGFEGPIGWMNASDQLGSGFPECLATDAVVDVRFAWVSVPELGTREVVAIHR